MHLGLVRHANHLAGALERPRDLLALLVLDHLALGPSENVIVRLRVQAGIAKDNHGFDLLPIKSLLVKNVGRRNGDSVPSRLS